MGDVLNLRLTLETGSASQSATVVGETPLYPNRICSGALPNPTLGRYYDLGCFVTPPPYTYGDSGRNILYGPGINNLDFAVHRVFHLPVEHDTTLEFRAEAYNLFNHPQFGMPANMLGQPQSGAINSTSRANRELQFALRLAF